MARIRLHIRYQGSRYSGWQKQTKSAAPTIQGHLEQAIRKLTGKSVQSVGSGRTDAGAHARMQVVHFESETEARRYPWVKALNAHLPEDIQVYEAFEAPDNFHALLSAEKKEYVYYIHNHELRPVFRRDFSWHVKQPLDLKWLNEASRHLIGTQDFKSLQNTGTEVPTTVKTVFSATWEGLRPSGDLVFKIVGDGFLKQMVRNTVGTLVGMYRSGSQTSEILKVLQTCDRTQAGPTAPASGLFLNRVKYPSQLDNQCRKL